MGKVNFSTVNAQVSDEVLNVSSSAAVNLMHDVFYNKTSKLVTVRTSAGGGGTLLVAGTDYNISGAIVDGDLPESISPDVAYTTIAIINATYQNVDLYITYYPIMDYWEVEDIVQLIQGIDLADKDISAATQTTDLTVYEPGGSSALQDGAIVNVSWSGGNTTYAHKFGVTSGWTIAVIGGPDLAPGDNSSTFAWCGYGTGFLKLKLDIVNNRWIGLSGIGGSGIFDKGTGPATGGTAGVDFQQYTTRWVKQSFISSTALTTAGNTVTLPIPIGSKAVASVAGYSWSGAGTLTSQLSNGVGGKLEPSTAVQASEGSTFRLEIRGNVGYQVGGTAIIEGEWRA